MPGDVNWDVDEFHLKDTNLTRLPDSPVCRVLVKLFLQDTDLTIIPPTFFEHMPVLEVLDLSNTNIVSLPTSISKLSRLQELLLRDCSSLMELPTEIGMLSNLKLFDINGTELMFIPEEMGKLKDLEVLRICLSQYAKHYIETNSVNEKVIPRKMISELKRLKELCVSISVGSEPEWWEEEVKDLQHELCDLGNLQTLRWYLPTSDILQQFLLLKRADGPIYKRISNLMLTIGQHAQITSCLPQGLERKFEEFKNCLKWINEEGNVNDISEIIPKAEALFLSRHWSIKKLSTYNITTLKYCLLAECNEMETLVEVDGLFEDGKTRIENSEKNGLELLQYLSIHHMKKLQSIWMGRIGKGSLSKLRILALHTCYQLTSIFTLTIAQNLSCLVEITVEDCPNVITLISGESHNVKYVPLFPSLQKIFLLDLPELVNIFVDDIMLNNLRTMLIYKCPQLRDLSNMDLPYIKKIEGQTEWWNSLGYDKSRWESFFVPLKKRRDLVEQLYKATNSLAHFHDVISEEDNEQKSSNLTDVIDQMIPAGTSMEKGKGAFIPPQETENKESDSLSRFEAPDTEPEDFNSLGVSNSEARPLGFSGPTAVSIGEVDSLSLSRQENDARESSDLTDVMEQEVVVDTSMQKEKGNLLPSGKGLKSLRSVKPTNLRVFTVDELKLATKNFCHSSKIGEGEFGDVYIGVVKSLEYPGSEIQVAVKYGDGLLQRRKEWSTEINILGEVKHPNLVKLVGYCEAEGELRTKLVLVYEYMPNGSLREHLSSRSKEPLPWTTRLKVAHDAACGLTYLHEDMKFQVILRKFISSNILLDEHWNAKLSDFWVARKGPGEGLTHISTNYYGMRECAPPEYVATGHLTSKSDVWSYGVFLYELITGRRPLDGKRFQEEQKLLKWVTPYINTKKFMYIIDPSLEGKYSLKAALKLSYIAHLCLSKNPKSRPKMSEVLEMVSKLIKVPSQATVPTPAPTLIVEEPKKEIVDPTEGEKTHDDVKHKGETRSMDRESASIPRPRSLKLLKSCFR